MKSCELMEKYSVPACVKEMRAVQTVADALAAPGITLAAISKEQTFDVTLAYIEMWVVDLNVFMNIKAKMTPPQIRETAHYIYEDYYYLKIQDLKVVFADIKKGRYGEIYNRLDGTIILNCFAQYAQNRWELSEQQGMSNLTKRNPDEEALVKVSKSSKGKSKRVVWGKALERKKQAKK